MELVNCSGEHDYGRNSAKVMKRKPSPKEDSEDEKYVKGYNLLEALAGEKQVGPSLAQPLASRDIALMLVFYHNLSEASFLAPCEEYDDHVVSTAWHGRSSSEM